MKHSIVIALIVLAAAGLLFLAVDKPDPFRKPPAYTYTHHIKFGFKNKFLFQVIENISHSAGFKTAQDRAFNTILQEDGIEDVLIADITSSQIIYRKNDSQYENPDDRLNVLCTEIRDHLKLIVQTYGIKVRIGITDIAFSTRFLVNDVYSNVQAMGDGCYSDQPATGYTLCDPAINWHQYHREWIYDKETNEVGVVGQRLVDALGQYYFDRFRSRFDQLEDAKKLIQDKYFTVDNSRNLDRSRIVSCPSRHFNRFHPDYFLQVPCAGGSPKDYFSLQKHLAFLQQLFTTLAADPLLKSHLSVEIGNESNLSGGAFAWMSPEENKALVLATYEIASRAGFTSGHPVVIGGFSDELIASLKFPDYMALDPNEPKEYPAIINGLYRDSVIPALRSSILSKDAGAAVTFSWHHYLEPGNAWPLTGMDALNDKMKALHEFDFLSGSVITEFNTASFIDPSTPFDEHQYINCKFFITEMGRLLDFCARYKIDLVYLFELYDLGSPSLGFFDSDGNPKPSYLFFRRVHDIVRNGYTVKRFTRPGELFNQCPVDYLEITPTAGSAADTITLRVALGYAPKEPERSYVQEHTNNEEVVCSNIVDEFMFDSTSACPVVRLAIPQECTLPFVADNYMVPGSWQIFTKNMTNCRLEPMSEPGGKPITFVPNPANCEGVEGRWEGIDLTQFNEVHFELSEVNTGQIVRLMAINKEINKIQLYSCELRQGLHEGRIIADGRIVAKGNLMVVR